MSTSIISLCIVRYGAEFVQRGPPPPLWALSLGEAWGSIPRFIHPLVSNGIPDVLLE